MRATRGVNQEPGGPRFAFVTLGSFSGINESALDALKVEFPSLAVEQIDVRAWIRSSRALTAANLLAVLIERGPRIFLDRTRLWGAFYRTAFLQKAIRRQLGRRCRHRGACRFTLQTQSFFDASVSGIPHFVYTDHTELVNRRYRDYDGARPHGPRWIAHERLIYEHARVTFTMSGHVSRSLIEQYGISPDRVKCVRAGSNVKSAREGEAQPSYGSQEIIFVGRDWERKGGPELLAAFRKVRRQLPGASLVVVGCSPPITESGVTVRGELSAAELDAAYLRAAVFCVPSRVEPFGIVFVEALAHGLPVVSSDIGALPDIVQHDSSGYLHEPGDVEAIARSLELLLGDPERCRQMGETGRVFVQARYTWSAVAAAIAEAIRNSLAANA